jgi:hypothetical protein
MSPERQPRWRRPGLATATALLALPLFLAPAPGPGGCGRARSTATTAAGDRAPRVDGGQQGDGAPRGGASSRPRAALPPETPWMPVHPERQARMAGVPVYQVCFDGTPPRKLAGGAPELLPSSPFRRFGGVLIAHCLIDPEGWVVSAQVLKTPDAADRLAVARALAGWRFEPARRAGRPVAVHFTVSIRVTRDG